uniref:Uncharacterized protein n=1 Tax=Pan troglodytes TaxID=9598 RepID=H2RIE7_PANTR
RQENCLNPGGGGCSELRLPRAPLPLLFSLGNSSLASGCNGPQLLLRRWCLLRLRQLPQVQRVQMHLLQEELLLLLPCGLCQVCPGLHLQRGIGEVQLLRLMSGQPCSQVQIE